MRDQRWKFGEGQRPKEEEAEIRRAFADGDGDEYVHQQQLRRMSEAGSQAMADELARRRARHPNRTRKPPSKRRPKPRPEPGWPVPSPTEVEAAMTARGGWTRATLATWGVPWPPPKGWRRELTEQYRARCDGLERPWPRGWSTPVATRTDAGSVRQELDEELDRALEVDR